MNGIEFVLDQTGDRKAVVIELAEHGDSCKRWSAPFGISATRLGEGGCASLPPCACDLNRLRCR